MCAEIAVDILLPLYGELVYARTAFRPLDIEMFPKGRCAFIQHTAVILLRNLQGLFAVAVVANIGTVGLSAEITVLKLL